MKGLIYQLKSVRKDKFCIMSFLLPIAIAIMLNIAGSIDLSSSGEYDFCVVEGNITAETQTWLTKYGNVTICQTKEEWLLAIKEPSTNRIGVEADGKGIRTVLSGDEATIWRQTASTLPVLYEQRELLSEIPIRILEQPDMPTGFPYILMAVTLIVAMFMGCTFNAMNILSEKENGVALINEILPMTSGQYVIQKIFIGFVFGCLSAVVTATICFRLSPVGAAAMLALTILSAFVAALIGLFVGHISDGLMAGIVYIKVIMIVFMTVPLLKYLVPAENNVLSYICYLIPSSATFEGIMELVNGSTATAAKDMVILGVHCVGWSLLYVFFKQKKGKQRAAIK
ncbi:MAG: ABC transporter permease [Lachnospiraceae bacterium]|nr:ABC transporter permease [Lachnospiraceae bacterium]